MDVKFNFIESRGLGEPDIIELEILGQSFREKFEVDKRFVDRIRTEAWDRERARLFGMKLMEIGKMIELQADKGKTQDIIVCQGTPLERTLHFF